MGCVSLSMLHAMLHARCGCVQPLKATSSSAAPSRTRRPAAPALLTSKLPCVPCSPLEPAPSTLCMCCLPLRTACFTAHCPSSCAPMLQYLTRGVCPSAR